MDPQTPQTPPAGDGGAMPPAGGDAGAGMPPAGGDGQMPGGQPPATPPAAPGA